MHHHHHQPQSQEHHQQRRRAVDEVHEYRLTKATTKRNNNSHDTIETIIKTVLGIHYETTNAKNKIYILSTTRKTIAAAAGRE